MLTLDRVKCTLPDFLEVVVFVVIISAVLDCDGPSERSLFSFLFEDRFRRLRARGARRQRGGGARALRALNSTLRTFMSASAVFASTESIKSWMPS